MFAHNPLPQLPHAHALAATSNADRRWRCNTCRKVHSAGAKSYICLPCDFDVCPRCFLSGKKPMQVGIAHPHGIVKTEKSTHWTCDTCRVGSTRSRQLVRWRCKEGCDWDMCGSCVQEAVDACSSSTTARNPLPQLPHAHALAATSNADRRWRCNTCRKVHSAGAKSYICLPCDFDVCPRCFLSGKKPMQVGIAHRHGIVKTEKSTHWTCDTCRVGSTRSRQLVRWRCKEGCDWDMCGSCVQEAVDSSGDGVISYHQEGRHTDPAVHSSASSSSTATSSTSGDATPASAGDGISPGQDAPDSVREELACCVCMDAKIDSVFVPCGHICCCIVCSEMVHRGKGTCPTCRTRIVSVVKCYLPT
eukprot:TRINITY_DN160_c0_g1_i1.p1 TRINITY_DN160_c0_g1~~TRINITY_DN160_c0_g1_i1.p1  ORF type:complete len:361 (-),score=45.55 TRINITY_DN160_c0_g1_i1:85-1167(-)